MYEMITAFILRKLHTLEFFSSFKQIQADNYLASSVTGSPFFIQLISGTGFPVTLHSNIALVSSTSLEFCSFSTNTGLVYCIGGATRSSRWGAAVGTMGSSLTGVSTTGALEAIK